MVKGSQKGSSFERELCKMFSLWWSEGERDDIFWRTAGSGARATVRKSVGKDTYGQNGDMQAIDPVGEPLLGIFTFEFKVGYGKWDILSMIDGNSKETTFQSFLQQAVSQCIVGTEPALVFKRDRHKPMICTTLGIEHDLRIRDSQTGKTWFCTSLEKFLANSPKEIISISGTRFRRKQK